jgi:hypothetical protein
LTDIIVGAGLSGLCSALQSSPGSYILEKQDQLGGKLSLGYHGAFSHGHFFIDSQRVQRLNQVLKDDPQSTDIWDYEPKKCETFGLLQANQLKECAYEDLFKKPGIKALGGLSAVKKLPALEAFIESYKNGTLKDQNFAMAIDLSKKDGLYLVLEEYLSAFGVCELATTSSIYVAKMMCEGEKYSFDWPRLFGDLEKRFSENKIQLELDAQVIGARYLDNQWTLTSKKGQFKGDRLIVAQSVWECIEWLPRNEWPPSYLHLATKTKPVSCVSLAFRIEDKNWDSVKELSELIFVPAEKAHVFISPSQEVCIRTALDFEVSMQAPSVVKAIRRLKRTRKRLEQLNEGFSGTPERISLVPVYWDEPVSMFERRFLRELKNSQEHIEFAGIVKSTEATQTDLVIEEPIEQSTVD